MKNTATVKVPTSTGIKNLHKTYNGCNAIRMHDDGGTVWPTLIRDE